MLEELQADETTWLLDVTVALVPLAAVVGVVVPVVAVAAVEASFRL